MVRDLPLPSCPLAQEKIKTKNQIDTLRQSGRVQKLQQHHELASKRERLTQLKRDLERKITSKRLDPNHHHVIKKTFPGGMMAPYVLKVQTQLCQTLHRQEVMARQAHINRKHHRKLTKFLKAEVMDLRDTNGYLEHKMINHISNASMDKDMIEIDYKQRIYFQEEQIKRLREELEPFQWAGADEGKLYGVSDIIETEMRSPVTRMFRKLTRKPLSKSFRKPMTGAAVGRPPKSKFQPLRQPPSSPFNITPPLCSPVQSKKSKDSIKKAETGMVSSWRSAMSIPFVKKPSTSSVSSRGVDSSFYSVFESPTPRTPSTAALSSPDTLGSSTKSKLLSTISPLTLFSPSPSSDTKRATILHSFPSLRDFIGTLDEDDDEDDDEEEEEEIQGESKVTRDAYDNAKTSNSEEQSNDGQHYQCYKEDEEDGGAEAGEREGGRDDREYSETGCYGEDLQEAEEEEDIHTWDYDTEPEDDQSLLFYAGDSLDNPFDDFDPFGLNDQQDGENSWPSERHNVSPGDGDCSQAKCGREGLEEAEEESSHSCTSLTTVGSGTGVSFAEDSYAPSLKGHLPRAYLAPHANDLTGSSLTASQSSIPASMRAFRTVAVSSTILPKSPPPSSRSASSLSPQLKLPAHHRYRPSNYKRRQRNELATTTQQQDHAVKPDIRTNNNTDTKSNSSTNANLVQFASSPPLSPMSKKLSDLSKEVEELLFNHSCN